MVELNKEEAGKLFSDLVDEILSYFSSNFVADRGYPLSLFNLHLTLADIACYKFRDPVTVVKLMEPLLKSHGTMAAPWLKFVSFLKVTLNDERSISHLRGVFKRSLEYCKEAAGL